MKEEWYMLRTTEIYKKLDSSHEGLTQKEAEKRLNKNGKNILPKAKKKTFIQVFLSELNSPIIYILILSMVLSFVVGEIIDGIFILICILLDAILGSVQEWKSGKNAEALEELVKVSATVIRDNEQITDYAENLVVGDIVLLESGTRVPADLRLIETQNLSIDESILTGESIARNKFSDVIKEETTLNNRSNMAYVGTSVMRGRGKGIVVSTGINTEIGKIATEVLYKEDTKTPLQIRMEKFTRELSIIIAILAIIIATILYFKNYAPREIFFLVIALSVSAIPEGLPVVLTLVLSIASNKMAKKNVLVKKLNAVEALGSATVIASDKTGTLTLNEQTAKLIILPNNEEFEITGNGYNGDGKIISKKNYSRTSIETLVKEAVYNNEAHLEKVDKDWISYGDSMDIALLGLGYKMDLDVTTLKNNVVARIPYESEEAYSAAFYKEDEIIKVALKGKLEKILKFASTMKVGNKIVPIDKELIKTQNESLARDGYRVLAFASGTAKRFKEKETYKESDIPDLCFLGLVAFLDPIRKDAAYGVTKCKNAGIKTVMITGDHPLTAFTVAKELGIASHEIEVVTGLDLESEYLKGEKSFDKFISTKKVFATVTPTQKLQIVESFKRLGEFIAVTGDGVNDAPALKAANVGIAMGSGTDVAKGVGSLIITDDKFSSIVNGVEEGRNAYNNVRKVTYMLLSCAVCEVIFFILSIWLDYELPLTAIQLLWLNLVTDGIQDIALAFESGENDVMKRSPRNPNESLFDRLLVNEVLFMGLIMGILVFSLWVYLIDVKHLDIVHARSYILLIMVFIQNLHCFNCRSEKISVFKKPIKENKMLAICIGTVLLIQFFVVENSVLSSLLGTISLPIPHIIILFILALPITLVAELFKYFERLIDPIYRSDKL